MLTTLRASKSFRHVFNCFIKQVPFGNISAQYYVKLQCVHPLKLYHSLSLTHKYPEFSIPKEDYSLNQDIAKENWMITKLCREGKIYEAREVFDVMPDKDVISWSALISGYLKCGLIGEARNMFDRVDGKKSVVTWTVMISGYLKTKMISEAEKLFGEMPDKNVVAWNTMIDGYIRNDMIEKAMSLFEGMGERNVVSWNMVITGLVNCGRVDEAKLLFDRMPIKDVISWTIMVSGLTRNGRANEARLLFDMMPERNVVSWNAMIAGYVQNSRLEEAYYLFENMPFKDVQSWNTMITGFVQNKDLDSATRLFNNMPQKNVVSWTVMMKGYMRCGGSEEALKLFFFMNRDKRVKPNDWTFVSVLGACADLAGLGEGMQAHQLISKSFHQDGEFIIAALINMYSKCGELMMARKVFNDGLKGRMDLVSWNSMIVAYAHHGRGKEAVKVFKEMQKKGFKPNDVTYVGLLSACSHSGLLEEGLGYFDMLLRDDSIKAREDHYACVVDMYSRKGKLKEALNLIEKIPQKDSSHVWCAFLLGCNIHGNVDVGGLLKGKLLDMECSDAGIYALLSNVYASSGKVKEAERVKLKMKEGGLKKQPGCSWIEIGNKFHVFVAGDRSHRENKTVNSLLLNLHGKMKKIGYVLSDNVHLQERIPLVDGF